MDDEEGARALEGMLEEGTRLLRKGRVQRALVVYETALAQWPDSVPARLGAAEASLALDAFDAAVRHLGETPPDGPLVERERWVVLKAEHLRRTSRREEVIPFVHTWAPLVTDETRGRLLWRKAAVLLSAGRTAEAARAIEEAWSVGPRESRGFLESISTYAYVVGNLTILREAAQALRSCGAPILAAYVAGIAWFASLRPWSVRLPIALLLLVGLVLPVGVYIYLALLLLLGVGWIVGKRNEVHSVAAVTSSFLLLFTCAYGMSLLLRAQHGYLLVLLAAAIVSFALLMRARRQRSQRTE